MLDQLVDLISGSPLAYAVVLGLVVFDAVLPVLPSETALITGGILAARGELSLVLLALAGGLGAIAGDDLTYTIGAKPGHRLRDRLLRTEKARRRLDRAARELDERPWLVAVARFVPGGRTAAMFAAGALDMPRGRFNLYVVPGALLWAAVTALLGYVGGRVFEESFWLPLLASLAVAALIGLGAELAHRSRLRTA